VVTAAAASVLVVSGFPSPIAHGTAKTFTVTAEDAFGNTATAYRGTVHFTSSDPSAVLPANYRFTGGDAGVHTFTAILKTVGSQSITAQDAITASITGTQGGIMVTAATLDEPFRSESVDPEDDHAILESNEDSPILTPLDAVVSSPFPGGISIQDEIATAAWALLLGAPGVAGRRWTTHRPRGKRRDTTPKE